MNSYDLSVEIENSCAIPCNIIKSPLKLPQEVLASNKNTINIVSMNIRSVFKNLDNFLVYLSVTKIDVHLIILLECWCDESSVPPLIDNYTVHFTNRSYNQNDGVIMYIKSDINASVEEVVLNDANCLTAKINDTVVIGIYRPYCFKKLDNFLDSLDVLLTSMKGNVISTGDINIDTLDTNSNIVQEYLEILGSHG
jgi:exonuclease III